MCVEKHAQITQSNKVAVSLQYLKKEVSDEVDFLHADKHKSLLQLDTTMICNVFTISQKEVSDEVDFLHADKHQNFLQVEFNTFGIKVSYNVILS